jgi:hypothetical protein
VVRYLGFWRRGGRTPRLYSVRDRMQGVRHRMYRLPGYFEAKKWKGYNLTPAEYRRRMYADRRLNSAPARHLGELRPPGV